MSEGAQGKKERELHGKEESDQPPPIAAQLVLRATPREAPRKPPAFPDVGSYGRCLAESLTLENSDATLVDLDRLASSPNLEGGDAQVQFLSSILVSLLEDKTIGTGKGQNSLQEARRYALRHEVDQCAKRASTKGFVSIICSALLSAAANSVSITEGNVIDLVKCLTGSESEGRSDRSEAAEPLLGISQSISVTAAVSLGEFGVESFDKSSIAEQAALILLRVLERHLLVTKNLGGALDFLPSELVRTVIFVLQTHSAFGEGTDLQTCAKLVVEKLVEMDSSGDAGESSSIPASKVAERLSPAGAHAGIGVINVLADLGPACTVSASTLRDTLRQITQKLPSINDLNGDSSSSLNEATAARLVHFFAERGTKKRPKEGDANALSSALVGALTHDSDPSGDGGGWDLNVVSQVLAEDYAHLDWTKVARSFDFPEFSVRDTDHLRSILNIYRQGATTNLPLGPLVTDWQNQAGQLSLLENMLAVPPSVFTFPVNDAEAADAATIGEEGVSCSCPNPQGWASADVLQRLLYISDVKAYAQKVRDLFVIGLLRCPEVLLCAVVRHQLSVASAAASGNSDASAAANASAGFQMKGELMRELIPLFFKPNPHHRVQNGPAALRRLWSISPNTVTAACIEAWRSTSSDTQQVRLATVVHIISIVRLLPSPENATATILNHNKDAEFSFAVAFVMADSDMLQLRPWLTERLSGAGTNQVMFAVSLVAYVGKAYPTASNRGNSDGKGAPLVSLENIIVSLQFLEALDDLLKSQIIPGSITPGDPTSTKGLELGISIQALKEACLVAHPSLKTVIPDPDNEPSSQDEIEELANSYFQKIYTSEESTREVVEMLKRFKSSGTAKENDIFACMIHNLFDEYRFFSKYPEKELRITGILFGLLIKEQLVSSITLGIALRYVLEALRKPPSPPGATTSNSGKMFRFGMFALEQFKGRLHEWPQYCSHIVQIPHLKQGYADLVAEIEGAMDDSQGRTGPAQSASSTGGRGSGGDVSSAISANASRSADESDSGQVAGKLEVPKTAGELGVEMKNAQQMGSAFGAARIQQNQQSLANGGVGGPFSLNLNVASTSTAQAMPSNIDLTPAAAQLAMKSKVDVKPRKAVFGPGLGRAVNREADSVEAQHENPPDAVLDRVQFLINNVSPSNVEQKAQELKDMLAPKYFGWLGHYLVVKRISTQPNFHSLYLNFLDQLGDYGKGLVEAILSSVYVNVGKLLRSPKITTSTSERSLLKNLGSWLGQITLARNRPILQIMLDCKELLFQGYETGMLIAVTPFVAKILEGAKNSVVFRPPNPWLMGLLSVFRALYGVDDLKMNIKFEVEVLCKNLGVKLEDIPLRSDDLAKRIPPVKERNPDFNIKSQQAAGAANAAPSAGSAAAGVAPAGQGVAAAASLLSSPDGKQATPSTAASGIAITAAATGGSDAARSQFSATAQTTSNGTSGGAQDQQQTVIPNLASYVNVNPSLMQLFQQPQGGTLAANLTAGVLKQAVPVAVDRAIREIIQPVVERSVTIACITTKEIVAKDFAMESDENKMRKAAQLMVANLAGSLALVTCREPLRVSVSTHLRQLLRASATGSSGNTAGNATPQLSDQEQSSIEQCVAICASENLELGCMLIEKAATEKAVRDMDEALAPALSTRKKHREQTGQPFYDMSIFGNGSQRYPSALPEPLRPKPGGLRPEQLLVYEAFQRLPRQPVVPSSQQSQVGAVSSGAGSELPPAGSGGGATSATSGAGASASVNIEALTAIAAKLDTAVTNLLSAAGARAQEINFAMIPPGHEIRQLLSAVRRVTSTSTTSEGVTRTLTPAEADTILGFAQGIFKRLYELSLTEPLRLEALVALLEGLNECCPQLGKDLGTWATYAPTKTDGQRKLHRTVLLLLLRSHLIPATQLDIFLAKSTNGGQDPTWVEFGLLFVRTAALERIASPAELPKLVDVLTKIGDGSSQVSQQIVQNYRKPILRLMEELRVGSAGGVSSGEAAPSTVGSVGRGVRPLPTHEQSSSISAVSLNNLAEATKKAAEASEVTASNDPPNIRQQVTFLLDNWIRVHSEAASNDKTLAQYLQLLQQHGIGKNEDQTERFLRHSTEIVVEACLKSASATGDASSFKNEKDTRGKVLNYNVIDAYAKLVCSLVRYMNGGGSSDQVAQQRLVLLNKILGITVRTMMSNYEQSQKMTGGIVAQWDQRPWFRLLLNLVHDLNSPNPALDPISLGILSIFGSAFHVVQPLVIPGFAFAWLELVSHRMFLSNLLLAKGQKGWGIAHQLLVDLFLFLEPHLRKKELTDAMKKYYDGTLRVLLVLLHDFPSFLAGYHLSFCNIIPENCVQLRNIVLSAIPKGINLPDPFPRNFKIDLLPEISQSPVVLSNVTGPLTSIRSDLDAFLKTHQPSDFVSGLLPRLYKEGTTDVDAPRVNSLVLYVGIQGLARLQNTQIAHTLAHTPEMDVLQKLMDFDDQGRYISLNAIANQLRFPSSHTHYFSCVMLFLFEEAKDESVKEQITRVLLERLITQRPHPWGLLITFVELIKNQKYQFWSHPFTRCATEIEKVFDSVARSCMTPRAAAAGGGDAPQ